MKDKLVDRRQRKVVECFGGRMRPGGVGNIIGGEWIKRWVEGSW